MLLPQEKIRLLSMVDVLEPLSEEELKEFGRRVPDTHVEQGQIFFTPGDRSEALFMLKKGRVRIYRVAPDGLEFTLAVVEAGTMFGEMALTAQQMRQAYAQATEPSDICILKNVDLERLVRSNPEVGIKMIHVLSERLRLCETRLEDVTLKDVPARLASLILQLAASEGIMAHEGPSYTHPLHPSAAGDDDRLQPRDRYQGLHQAAESRGRGAKAQAHLRQGHRSPRAGRWVRAAPNA